MGSPEYRKRDLARAKAERAEYSKRILREVAEGWVNRQASRLERVNRRAVLSEVAKNWRLAPTPEAFARWLATQLELLK